MKFVLVVLAAVIACSYASMFAEVTIKEFINRSGQSADGKCCDQKTANNCRCGFLCGTASYCDYIFDVCLEPMPNANNNPDTCSGGWTTTNVVADNTNNVVLKYPFRYGAMMNPFRVNFPGGWKGAIFKYRVWDSDTFGQRELVDKNSIFLDANFNTQQFYTKSVMSQRSNGAEPTEMKMQVYLNCNEGFSGPNCEQVSYSTCAGWFLAGQTQTGIYNLNFNGLTYRARCDMSTNGGGWTVVQDRSDGQMDFDKSFPEYIQGFGTPPNNRDYWFGLEKISQITMAKEQSLRIQVSDCQGQQKYEDYSTFRINPRNTNYRLQISGGTGQIGDSMNSGSRTNNNNMQFSTYDHDSDQSPNNCADVYKGGWWYNSCTQANLNGKFFQNCQTTGGQQTGIFWESWRGSFYSLRTTRMMIRPRQFLEMVKAAKIVPQKSVATLEV